MRTLAWACLLTAAAVLVVLCVFIWATGSVDLEVGERAFFLSSPFELLAAFGLILITFFFGSKLRRGTLPVWIAFGAIGAVWIYLLAQLYPTRPERVGLGELAAPVDPFDPAKPAKPAKNDRKVLLIGVDAMSWNRLLPLVRQGMLPHIGRLMDEGSYAVLHSHKSYRAKVNRWSYWSPVVWTTIATGVYPEKHGIDDFQLVVEKPKRKKPPRKKKRGVPAGSHHRLVPAFWNIYSHFGKSVGVVGWWASWPAEEVRGILVSSNLALRGRRRMENPNLDDASWFSERQQLTYPEDYVDTVADEIGLPKETEALITERIFPFDRYRMLKVRDWDNLRMVVWQDQLFARITEHMLRHEDFALYTTYLEGVDAVSHKFWRYMAFPDKLRPVQLPGDSDLHARIVDRYYAVVDSYIGSLLEAAGEDMTVVICSDHGFRTAPEQQQLADHSGYGVLIVKGPGIRKSGNELSLRGATYDLVHGEVGVEDVLPTLLYMQGLPISEELDGGIKYRFFERSYLSAHPEIRTPTYSEFFERGPADLAVPPEDVKEYRERLRSLGYIN